MPSRSSMMSTPPGAGAGNQRVAPASKLVASSPPTLSGNSAPSGEADPSRSASKNGGNAGNSALSGEAAPPAGKEQRRVNFGIDVKDDSRDGEDQSPRRGGIAGRSASASSTADGEGNKPAGHIQVAVRVRPFSEKETLESQKRCVEVDSARNVINVMDPAASMQSSQVMNRKSKAEEPKEFVFDKVYGSNAQQYQLMQDLGVGLCSSILQGYNCCLFAYGQTGSGKTFSVLGVRDDTELRGLMPRMIETIFSDIDEQTENLSVQVSVTYLEIYNEQFRDLLARPEDKAKKIELHQNPAVGIVVSGVVESSVQSWEDADTLLQLGQRSRAIACTMMNAESSRSHCIFTLEIIRRVQDEFGKTQKFTSKANFVDLAGSERMQKTGAQGSTAKEGININSSLMHLANVITHLANSQNTGKKEYIPFRNSKLTYLLQDSLSGSSMTLMLANLSPAHTNQEETLGTLKFAKSVKSIKVAARKNACADGTLVEELKAEIARLHSEITSQRSSPSGASSDKMMRELSALESLFSKHGEAFRTQVEAANTAHERIQEHSGMTAADMSESLLLSRDTPQLVNIHYDPSLNGALIYFLVQDQDLVVGTNPDCKIHLKGLGMEHEMATIRNSGRHKVSITVTQGRVMLNGYQVKLEDNERKLDHNDRLIFGYAFSFRMVFPDKAAARRADSESSSFERKARARQSTIEDVMEEVVPEEFQHRREELINLQDRYGKVRTQALLNSYKRVCAMAEQANAITREVHPPECQTFRFTAEVLVDVLDNDKSPDCIVRLERFAAKKVWKRAVKRVLKQQPSCERKHRLSGLLGSLGISHFSDGDYRTVWLLEYSQFKDRMRHLERVYELFTEEGIDALDFSLPEHNPWAEVQTQDYAEQIDDRRRSRMSVARTTSMGRSISISSNRDEGDDAGKPDKKQAVLMDKLQKDLANETARANEFQAQVAALQAKAQQEEALRLALEAKVHALEAQARAAPSSGSGASQEEEMLERHLARAEAAEHKHSRTYREMQSELQAELRSEVEVLGQQLEELCKILPTK